MQLDSQTQAQVPNMGTSNESMQPSRPMPQTPAPKPPVNNAKPSNSGGGMFSFTSLLILLAVLFLGAYSGYLYFQNGSLGTEKASLDLTVTELRGQQDSTESKASIGTKAIFYSDKSTDRIFWTNFVNQTLKVIPKSASSSTRAGNLLSILANEKGSVTMSFESSDASQDPFFDTALLIQVLRDQNYLDDVFIPSISSRRNELGRDTLTYTINAKLIIDELRLNLLDEEDLFLNLDTGLETNTPAPAVESDALREQIESLQDRVETDGPTIDTGEPVVETDEPTVETDEPVIESDETSPLTTDTDA